MAAAKLDLYAKHKEEYATPKDPVLLTIKPARYLAIEGRGEPGGDAFQAAVNALYNVAFTVKMARKDGGRDYVVSKLEALWWGKAKHRSFLEEPKATWLWQLVIRVPDWIQAKELAQAAEGLVKKGKSRDVMNVELASLNEGPCVQVLHTGSYDEEYRTVEEMQAFAKLQGLAFHGRHHEIYLSDPRRVPAPKLRTILRQPVKDGHAS
jgi:hypothetical protein